MADSGASATARPRVAVETLQDFYRRAFEAVDLPPTTLPTCAGSIRMVLRKHTAMYG